MTHGLNMLAFDLGAESGRAVLGTLVDDRLVLTEVHRFANIPVRLPDGLHWDVLHLFSNMLEALTRVGQQHDLASIGVDAWGNDFALVDATGALLGNPYHYRDSRTDGMLHEALRRVSRAEIFAQTGIQFMQANGLYQLFSMVVRSSPQLQAAAGFLTIPDLFNYWLCGARVCEFTNATTTQCYDPRRGDWARPLLAALGIPTYIFPRIVPAGTVLGALLPGVAAEAGVGRVPVVAPACHDTGSAVAAVPADGRDWAWISSGTWSIMGAEVPAPLIDEESLRRNMTNEGGVAGTFRYCKNIAGLWLVQECRRAWARSGEAPSYAELTDLAAEAPPFQTLIDPDDYAFVKPGDMPARIRAYCKEHGEPVPATQGAVVRAVLEGIALRYRLVLEMLESRLGRRLEPIHIVGGGSKNRLLCQLTADATGRRVVAGPSEASAAGNALMQAVALGYLGSLAEVRAVARASFPLATYEPRTGGGWEEFYGRFKELVAAEEAGRRNNCDGG